MFALPAVDRVPCVGVCVLCRVLPRNPLKATREKLTLGDVESRQVSVCLSSGLRTAQSRRRQGVCPAGCPGPPEDAGQHRLDAASFFRVKCYAFNYLKGRERASSPTRWLTPQMPVTARAGRPSEPQLQMRAG